MGICFEHDNDVDSLAAIAAEKYKKITTDKKIVKLLLLKKFIIKPNIFFISITNIIYVLLYNNTRILFRLFAD